MNDISRRIGVTLSTMRLSELLAALNDVIPERPDDVLLTKEQTAIVVRKRADLTTYFQNNYEIIDYTFKPSNDDVLLFQIINWDSGIGVPILNEYLVKIIRMGSINLQTCESRFQVHHPNSLGVLGACVKRGLDLVVMELLKRPDIYRNDHIHEIVKGMSIRNDYSFHSILEAAENLYAGAVLELLEIHTHLASSLCGIIAMYLNNCSAPDKQAESHAPDLITQPTGRKRPRE